MMVSFVMLSKTVDILINSVFRQSCLWIILLLSQFFANITIIMLDTIMTIERILIVKLFIITKIARRMISFLMLMIISPFEKLLFK